MSLRVLTPGPEWDAVMQRLVYDLRDVHISSGWARAHETETAKAYLLVRESSRRFMVCQPVLLRRIGGTPFNDLYWPGYGGPLADHPLPAMTDGESFDAEVNAWRSSNNVVSEFYLLNPAQAAAQTVLIDGTMFGGGKLILERAITIIPADVASVLRGMRPNRKEAYRKGDGAEVDWLEPESAQALYDIAMDRSGASPRWRLHGHLARLPKDRTRILGARLDGRLMAMAVFLLGAESSYYYLAARAPECPTGLSDHLIMAGVQLAHEHGSSWLNLGGGVTAEPDDSLAAYKRSWGGFTRPLYSVRRIHDAETYKTLTGLGPSPTMGFFPAYRQEESQ